MDSAILSDDQKPKTVLVCTRDVGTNTSSKTMVEQKIPIAVSHRDQELSCSRNTTDEHHQQGDKKTAVTIASPAISVEETSIKKTKEERHVTKEHGLLLCTSTSNEDTIAAGLLQVMSDENFPPELLIHAEPHHTTTHLDRTLQDGVLTVRLSAETKGPSHVSCGEVSTEVFVIPVEITSRDCIVEVNGVDVDSIDDSDTNYPSSLEDDQCSHVSDEIVSDENSIAPPRPGKRYPFIPTLVRPNRETMSAAKKLQILKEAKHDRAARKKREQQKRSRKLKQLIRKEHSQEVVKRHDEETEKKSLTRVQPFQARSTSLYRQAPSHQTNSLAAKAVHFQKDNSKKNVQFPSDRSRQISKSPSDKSRQSSKTSNEKSRQNSKSPSAKTRQNSKSPSGKDSKSLSDKNKPKVGGGNKAKSPNTAPHKKKNTDKSSVKVGINKADKSKNSGANGNEKLKSHTRK